MERDYFAGVDCLLCYDIAQPFVAMKGNEAMEGAGVGWIAAIIIGGIAGWLASNFMKSDTGVLVNVILGIIGAAVASFIFGLVGISFGGWLGYLIAGIIGACILIWGYRAVKR